MQYKSVRVKFRGRRQPREEQHPKKLLDQVRDAIRLKHYSYRTEQAYVGCNTPWPAALAFPPDETVAQFLQM